MNQNDLIGILSEKEYILPRYVYPVLSGLIIAYFISALINVSLFTARIESPESIKSLKGTGVNKNLYVKNILDRNVFRLSKGKENLPARMGGSTVPPVRDSLKDYELVGTVLGKESLAIFKKDKELVIVRKGEKVRGYELKDVTFEGVVLKGPKGDLTLSFPEKIQNLPGKRQVVRRSSSPIKRAPEPGKVIVKRSEVLSTSQDLNKLLTTVRIAPYFRKDEFLGYRINMLKRNSFLYRLGLRAGDILQRINGEEIDSPDKAIEMLSKLDDITAVNVDLLRRGQKKTLFIEIED